MARMLLTALVWAALAAGATAEPAFDPDAATDAWIATMGAEATARSNAYFEGGYLIQFFGAGLTVAFCALVLVLGWTRGVRTILERTVKARFLVTFGASAYFIAVLSIATFPFDWWVGFVREHEFGLATQDIGGWLRDYAVNFALNVVLFSLFLTAIYAIARRAGDSWWIWASGVTALFFAVIVAVSPVYINPLFNTYTPMAEGALKADIVAMAQANGVPADDVFTYDESKQSNRVTANVAGLAGTTRVALADNLLTRISPEGVRMVMAHELGHYVLGHILSLIFMLSAFAGVLYACVHFSFRALSKNERWGVRDLADPAGLPLALGLFVLFAALAAPINNNIIRFHEHQADIFGLNASREPDGFAETALLLSEYRKMAPSPLEEWLFYDHPSGRTRIHMAMQWKANEMAAGRYPEGPGGPPPGYRPDFVVMKDAPSSPALGPSPAAPSD